MLHGDVELLINRGTVQVAVEEYLQKHFASDVAMVIKTLEPETFEAKRYKIVLHQAHPLNT